MESTGINELLKLCEESDIVRMTMVRRGILIEVSAWSAVICEIMLVGIDREEVRAEADCFFGSKIPEGLNFVEIHSLEQLENGYRLCFYDFNSDDEESFDFAKAQLRCEPCNALCERIEDYTRLQNPWEYLGLVARGICCHIEYGVANNAELGIKELAEFLEVMQGDWESVRIYSTQNEEYAKDTESTGNGLDGSFGFPDVFIKYAKEYGAYDVVKKYASDYRKLFNELSKEVYEPFWRQLYTLLADTQDGIMSHAERCCDAKVLQEYRKMVTLRMHEQGFIGDYPCFCSKNPILSPCLHFAYESAHIAFRERNAQSFILCREQNKGKSVEAEIFCGIKFNPKDEDDVFSCLFDCGGKSHFSCFTSISDDSEAGLASEYAFAPQAEMADGSDADDVASEIEAVICAACKSARLHRLTKDEYSYKHTAPVWNSPGFYITFFVTGLVLFGALITVGFMLIEAVLVMLFTQSLSEVGECFCATPWMILFWASGLLYASGMTVSTFLSMRK